MQHIALATDDIVADGRRLRDNGVEFLRVPATYYEDLEARVGKIDEPVDVLADLGILADSDDEGYLLQIFTEPVQDRPTLFFEVIERQGRAGSAPATSSRCSKRSSASRRAAATWYDVSR